MSYLGIDIGSLSCDVVLIDDNEIILASAVVPTGCCAGLSAPISPLSTSTACACTASPVREVSEKRDTDAMLGSASPRKPMLRTDSRSSSEAILLVA